MELRREFMNNYAAKITTHDLAYEVEMKRLNIAATKIQNWWRLIIPIWHEKKRLQDEKAVWFF